MKVHITENIDKVIENYKMVPIVYGKVDLSIFPNNSLTHIIATDALDSIPYSSVSELMVEIKNKIRSGGTIVIGGLELCAVCRDITNNKISTDDFNHKILDKKGLYKSKDIVSMLNNIGLTIDSMIIKGYNYEITASRPKISN